MAISFNNLGASATPDLADLTGRSSYSTASWTPPASGLIFLFVVSRETNAQIPNVPTVSGNGISWVQIATALEPNLKARLTLFGANAAGSSAGQTTIDFNGQVQMWCLACFARASGTSVEKGSTVVEAFVQAPSNNGFGTSGSIGLASASEPGNRPIACFFHGAGDAVTPRAGWTEFDDVVASALSIETQVRSDAFETTASASWGTSAYWVGIAAELRGVVLGEASLQGVAVLQSDASLSANGDALLQGVAQFLPNAAAVFGGQGTLPAVAHILAEAEGVRFRDFTRFDAYLDTPTRSQGLLFYDALQPETVARRLQPQRTDVGDNPDEIRPDFGTFFAQSDFSHGMGQRHFHRPSRDPARFFWSEGFDVSEPGKLRHLRALAQAVASANIGALAQVAGLPFVADGTGVKRGNGAFPGTWTAEDPHAGETATTVEDLAAQGARLFAALGVNGVHVRDAAGTWSHYKPDGTNNLNISPATRVAWVKDRLMVVGGTDSRSIYEVTSSSTPAALETLPEGWRFEHVFEAGGFIHACAVNTAAGLSRIHHYGLNSSGTALEKKSSTPLPKDQIAFSGAGYLGLAFLGVGKRNSSGGYDPILYRATIREGTGELDYVEVREETGAGANDLGVRAIAPLGESVLVGWSLGSGAFGGARDGIAVYHLARDAFAHHLRVAGGGGARRVLDIMPFDGRVLISLAGAGLYYEDLGTYVSQAQLVTSLGDFNNAGPKIWDLVELAHDPLPSGTSVKVEYATAVQEAASWLEVFTSATANSEGKSGRLSSTRARLFALRITSNALAASAPEIRGYSVRGNPSPLTPEFQLTRYVRLLAKDRRDEQGELIYQDPREILRWLQDQLWSFVGWHESGFDWTCWLEDVSTVEPAQPFYDQTSGEPLKDAFVVRLVMTGTR